jgi:hypothetical protein
LDIFSIVTGKCRRAHQLEPRGNFMPLPYIRDPIAIVSYFKPGLRICFVEIR